VIGMSLARGHKGGRSASLVGAAREFWGMIAPRMQPRASSCGTSGRGSASIASLPDIDYEILRLDQGRAELEKQAAGLRVNEEVP
jgi:hypothetical protein